MAKAMVSGDPNIVFDWLTTGELTSMIQQAGKSMETPANRQDRVLVMIESREGKQVNIPIPLQLYDEKHPDKFYSVVKRLKKSVLTGLAKKHEAVFLTGAGVVQNEEADLMREENSKLQRELKSLKAELQRKNNQVTSDIKEENDVRKLKAQVAELQIELSALPVLKNQLKEKVKELEVMNMYVREVEICTKIRAPIPNLNSYKVSLLGNSSDNLAGDASNGKGRPAVTGNVRGRNVGGVTGTQPTKKVPGTAPAMRSAERKQFLPSRELGGVYRTNVSGTKSRGNSNSSNS